MDSKTYKKKNGYIKHYTATGKPFRVKIVDTRTELVDITSVLIRFKTATQPDTWLYTYPKKTLPTINVLLNYLGRNAESDGVVYNVRIS